MPVDFWIPWLENLRRAIGVDPEICHCGAKMIVDDVVTRQGHPERSEGSRDTCEARFQIHRPAKGDADYR